MDYSASAIPRAAFIVTISVFLAISILFIALRIFLHASRRIALDRVDALLGLVFASLIAASGLALKGSDTLYLATAILSQPGAILDVPLATLDGLSSQSKIYFSAPTTLLWSTIFGGKAAVLWCIALKVELARLKWLARSFHAAVICTAIAWVLLIVISFTPDSVSRLRSNGSAISAGGLYVGVVSLTAGLDIITNILIALLVSIVHRRKLVTEHILYTNILAFGCVLATIFTILRVCKVSLNGNLDLVWQLFWHHLEASSVLGSVALATIRATVLAVRQGNPSSSSIPLAIRESDSPRKMPSVSIHEAEIHATHV